MINPLGLPRRAAVLLPDASPDLRPEGPLRAGQLTDEGVYAVVDLPPFGFAWVPAESDLERPPAATNGLSARDRELRNESIAIEVDATTGGLRSIAGVDEPSPRLAQQLVVQGLVDAAGKPVASQMRRERFDVDFGGPALVQATAVGHLVDPRQGNRLASFEQRYRLWTGRPILEIRMTPERDRRRRGSSMRRGPTRGRATWPADGPGPTPARWSAGRCSATPS